MDRIRENVLLKLTSLLVENSKWRYTRISKDLFGLVYFRAYIK